MNRQSVTTPPTAPIHPTSRRWVQFSLKSLMLLMLVTAACFSGWSVAVRQARVAETLARREAEMARQAKTLLGQARPQRANSTPADADAAVAIGAVLQLQAEAWNAGQIDRFMEHYWKSDELTFSAGGQTTRGWQNTLDRYRQRYPSVEKMGRLTFDHLEVHPLGETAALVLGQWRLAREEDALDGNFSLVVRKLDGRWIIVHDHTSRAEKLARPPAVP